MKKSEIRKGVVYHNGKTGRFYGERLVVDIGLQGEYRLYQGQADSETVRYRTLKGSQRGDGNMTLTSFASWAKGVVG